MTGPEDRRPVGGLPAWPSVPPAGEPTPPPADDVLAPPADDTSATPATPAEGSVPVDLAKAPVPAADSAAPAVPSAEIPSAEVPSAAVPSAAVPDATAAAPAVATGTGTAPAPAPASDTAGAPAVGRRAPLLVLALALVVALLGAACVALLLTEQRQGDRADRQLALAVVQDPSGPALRAASTAVETLLSYDYTRLDADFAAGRELLTPAFAEQYAEFTDKLVRPPALQARARVVARTQVLAPTEATTADRVVVLAFVDQTTTSALLDAPALDQSRVTLTLEPVDGRWLVADLVVTGSRPGGG